MNMKKVIMVFVAWAAVLPAHAEVQSCNINVGLLKTDRGYPQVLNKAIQSAFNGDNEVTLVDDKTSLYRIANKEQGVPLNVLARYNRSENLFDIVGVMSSGTISGTMKCKDL